MRLKVLNYDKEKARNYFVLFKLAEIFGLFLFVFGFKWFGEIAQQIGRASCRERV